MEDVYVCVLGGRGRERKVKQINRMGAAVEICRL